MWGDRPEEGVKAEDMVEWLVYSGDGENGNKWTGLGYDFEVEQTGLRMDWALV